MLKDHLRHGKRAARPGVAGKELHRFRIATKEIRYTVDLFAPLYGEAIHGFTEKLKQLQTDLGSIHDCAATSDLVRNAQSATGRQDILRALDKRREGKTERFLRDYNREFQTRGEAREWRKALRHP
jgi:CHAD domain-containing protein